MARKIWVSDDEASTRFPVYTRGNVGEVFVEAASPLTWSAYGPHSWELGWRDAFYEMGVFTPDEFKSAGACEIVGCFGGYVYLNMSVTRVMAARIPGLSVAAIDAALFGDYPDVPPYVPDPRDRNPERTAQVSAWLKSLFTTDAKQLTDRDRAHLEAMLAQRPDLTAMSDAQLLERFRCLRAENQRYFKRHILNTYGANVLSSIIAQFSHAAGAGHYAAEITAAVGDIDSAQQSYELWELSRQVSASPALSAAFDRGLEGLLDDLHPRAEAAVKHFLTQWDRFIERWGFLGPSVWEFRSATYRTDPQIVLRMLNRLRHAPDLSAPNLRSAALTARREAAVTDIAERLGGNADVQAQFIEATRCVGNYLAARERSKHLCARIIDEIRAPLHELGQRLVKHGMLSRWEHLLLVTNEEANTYVADPAAHRGLIAERAAQLEMLLAKEPPFVFEGEPPPLAAFRDRSSVKPEIAGAGAQLVGIGVSPGRCTGRARVIKSLSVDSDLEPGEVIVAPTTDASWGPLFLAAGAVVVETGAAISHAAIVARELGIPAAVSVTGATRRIRDGTTITVDGNTGTVTVH